jgi:hypothetical protein
MKSFLALLTVPIMLLNFGGGIVGGIWLLFLGKWALVVGVLLVSWAGGGFAVSLVMMPGNLLFGLPSTKLLQRGNTVLAYVFAALCWIYNYLIMTAWSVVAFVFVLSHYAGGSIWPYLLFAYSAATGLWTYMAQHETRGGNEDAPGTTVPVFFACVGAVTMMGITLWGNANVVSLASAFGAAMCVSLVIQSISFFSMARALRAEMAASSQPLQ